VSRTHSHTKEAGVALREGGPRSGMVLWRRLFNQERETVIESPTSSPRFEANDHDRQTSPDAVPPNVLDTRDFGHNNRRSRL
jgi:hypothetical protein